MKIASVVVFGLAALLQLIACALDREALRRVTKPLLMPLLIVCVLAWSTVLYPAVLAAMVLGWLGDTLLLATGKKQFFIAGAVCFCGGHLLYMHAVCTLCVGTLQLPILLLSLPFVAAPIGLTAALRTELARERSLRVPMPLYFCVLSGLCICCLFAVCTRPGMAASLLLTGSVLFLISDGILATLVLKKGQGAGCGNFWVMFFYILAQTILAAAFCLT